MAEAAQTAICHGIVYADYAMCISYSCMHTPNPIASPGDP